MARLFLHLHSSILRGVQTGTRSQVHDSLLYSSHVSRPTQRLSTPQSVSVTVLTPASERPMSRHFVCSIKHACNLVSPEHKWRVGTCVNETCLPLFPRQFQLLMTLLPAPGSAMLALTSRSELWLGSGPLNVRKPSRLRRNSWRWPWPGPCRVCDMAHVFKDQRTFPWSFEMRSDGHHGTGTVPRQGCEVRQQRRTCQLGTDKAHFKSSNLADFFSEQVIASSNMRTHDPSGTPLHEFLYQLLLLLSLPTDITEDMHSGHIYAHRRI